MIVIPMAGSSSRFTDAGYRCPKYMLPLYGKTVFHYAVESFRNYFSTEVFLFIVREVAETAAFVQNSCAALGIRTARVVMLDTLTAGQGETVELGLREASIGDREPITIFNVDTFRPNFHFPEAEWWTVSDGYLEVFSGSGANWSYVLPSKFETGKVLETAEKQQISDLCCTGLYHFTRAGDFRAALASERARPSGAELYVAPLYNHLIADGRKIHFNQIASEEVVFCGVPAEYEALLRAPRF